MRQKDEPTTHEDAAPEYALPQGHRERLAATIEAVAAWRREKAHEAQDVHQDKRAAERSNRARFSLKVLHSFVLYGLSDDDADLGAFRYTEPEGDRYRISPETWDLLSRFGMARGTLAESGGKPTDAQMRNILRRAEGREQAARAEERRSDDPAYRGADLPVEVADQVGEGRTTRMPGR